MPPKRVRGQSRKKSGDNDDSDYAPPPESDEEEDEYEDEYQDDEPPPSPQPRRRRLRKKPEPIRCTILPEFYGNIYKVDLSGNRDADGVVIKPDKRKYWDVSMDVLDDDDAEALLDSVPEIRTLRDLGRAALEPFKEDDPDMRKRGGSGTIGLTFGVLRTRRGAKVTQLYYFQKKLGIIVDRDYAGSFRIEPVMDAFFAPDVLVYNLDLQVTKFPLTNKAEGAAWWSGITYLGPQRRNLCEQMPIGRVPSYGLTSPQRTVIERLVEKDPKHPLKYLLRAPGGTEFGVRVVKLGKMTPKAAAAHLRYVAQRRIGPFRSTSLLPNSPVDVPQACQRRASFTRQGRPRHNRGGDALHCGSQRKERGQRRRPFIHGGLRRDLGALRQGHAVHGGRP